MIKKLQNSAVFFLFSTLTVKDKTLKKMYSIYDYIHNGMVFVNNVVRRQHKELTSLMIYSTTSCQSRCKHCSIWKKPTENLSLVDISRIMNSKCVTKSTIVGLEGGEFILHPEADNILEF